MFEPNLSINDISSIMKLSRQAVHKKLSNLNILCHKKGKIGYLTHNQTKILFSHVEFKATIAVQHIKGGVGKTTSADALGDFFSLIGAKVLKVDADFQKNLTSRYGISTEDANNTPVLIDIVNGTGKITDSIIHVSEGVDLIPSRFENASIDSVLSKSKCSLDKILEKVFHPIKGNYDIIIFDCPAMLGKLVTAITLYSDLILCPLNPEKYSIEGLSTLQDELMRIELAYSSKINYKVFLNKFESSTKLSNSGGIISILEKEISAGKGYDQAIKRSQEVKNALQNMQTVFSYVKKSDVREDFINLGMQIIDINKQLKCKPKTNKGKS